AEVVRAHNPMLSKKAARGRSVELLRLVGVPSPEMRSRQYPHEFSGGMRQRVLIAIATANSPRLLIADEPTTALDVTVQAEILEAIAMAQGETGAASILVTHDFGVIAEMADRVAVMYAGRIVELAAVTTIFSTPMHPYTAALLASLPQAARAGERLVPIEGTPPNLAELPVGCPFEPRCGIGHGRIRCRSARPALARVGPSHASACHYPAETVAPIVEERS